MFERKCKFCGRQFRTNKSFQIFCSPRCRQNNENQKNRLKRRVKRKWKCVVCGKEFQTYNDRKRFYCSDKCGERAFYYKNPERFKAWRRKRTLERQRQRAIIERAKHPLLRSNGNKPKRGKILRCPVCGKEFYVKPYEAKTESRVCCSRECYRRYQLRGKPLHCKYCGKEYYVPPAQIKWRGSSFCSVKCAGLWRSKYLRGEKSPGWKGGKSSIYRRLRSSKEFEEWRRKVFERDNYTCQICGIRSGQGRAVKLHPHHIKSFTQYPKLRFSVENGLTVCIDCHNLIHNREKTRGRPPKYNVRS